MSAKLSSGVHEKKPSSPDAMSKRSMRSRFCTPAPVGVTRRARTASASSRELTTSASAVRGIVSEATAAVDTPRRPMPVSESAERHVALTKYSAKDTPPRGLRRPGP